VVVAVVPHQEGGVGAGQEGHCSPREETAEEAAAGIHLQNSAMGEVVEEAVRRLRIQQLSERCYCHLLTEEAAAEAEAAGNWEVEEAAAARTSVPTAFLERVVLVVQQAALSELEAAPEDAVGLLVASEAQKAVVPQIYV
jgi:hypothetical protein